jgi:hypothetical protein
MTALDAHDVTEMNEMLAPCPNRVHRYFSAQRQTPVEI